MNTRDLLFRTNRFNLSSVHPHFINPCCFGEDLAAWLRGKLSERGIAASQPFQEDWGWELPTDFAGNSYYLGMSGNSGDGATDNGEWRIIIEKRRSIWDRITGKGKITEEDRMLALVEDILANQPDFHDVRRAADEA
jgi:hypothetical protein